MPSVTFQTILAAVDASPRAAGVVAAAITIAERFDGTVHLFRVVTSPPEFANPPDDLEKLLGRQTRDELAALALGHPRVVVEEPELGPHEPWRAVLDRARKLAADLIVVGSHGYRGWDRLLGTTAAKIADHADRSVLVVHERSTRAALGLAAPSEEESP